MRCSRQGLGLTSYYFQALSTSSIQIEIWQDIMQHYAAQPERQQQQFTGTLRKAIMPQPP